MKPADLSSHAESIETLLQRAVALHRSGSLAMAYNLYGQILNHAPLNADARHLIGLVLYQQHALQPALQHLEQAANSNPPNALFHYDYGRALAAAAMPDMARLEFKTALALRPAYVEALIALGTLERLAGDSRTALMLFSQALTLREGDPVLHHSVGTLLQELDRSVEAVVCFRKAVQLNPQAYQSWFNLALALRSLGNLDDAAVALCYVVRFQPSMAQAFAELSATYCLSGNLAAAEESLRQAAALAPSNEAIAGQQLFNRHYYSGITRQALFDEHRAWAEKFCSIPAVRPAPNVNKKGHAKIRIGYVSPDFYAHPVGFFMAPLLEHHDRSRFEIVIYSNTLHHDRYTEQFKKGCDGWRDIKNKSDDDAQNEIRQDELDVLVDCAGHAAGNRIKLFAKRSAPVQIAWLGYPSTTGLSTIDYRLTDEILDPVGSEPFYTEKLVRLPGGFACYRPHDAMPEVKPRQINAPIVFGSLHNPARLNDAVIERWCAVLRAVPDSLLMVYRMNLPESTKTRLVDVCEKCAIPASRLIFKNTIPAKGYAAVYNDIDIALDTFPWSGHTTACEGLWMGVPMITQRNDTAVGRLVCSALHFAGLDELIADSADDYIARAVSLANDRLRLKELRASLRLRMQQSTLCDERGFAKTVEDVYCRVLNAILKNT